MVKRWKDLQPPDPLDVYTTALKLTDDIARTVELYGNLLHSRLKAVGFFFDKGHFDITEKLCIAINNLQSAQSFLDYMPEHMNIHNIAEVLDRHLQGPSRETVMLVFESMIESAKVVMINRILFVIEGVAGEMKSDTQLYIINFAQEITQRGSDVGFGRYFHKLTHKMTHDANEGGFESNVNQRALLESRADAAAKPLMQYLQENTRTLYRWLCEPNFQSTLKVVWGMIVRTIHKVALVDHLQEPPGFFYQFKHLFRFHLFAFFNAEGRGIPSKTMKDDRHFKDVDAELKIRCERTSDLIRRFYKIMYEEQLQLESKPIYGFLNVFAGFDQTKSEIRVEVVSANQLLPLDKNGLSDPFVKLRLAPVMTFRTQAKHRTLVEKNTLDPVWLNENFSFKVNPSAVAQEGNVVVFTVFDHDVLSANDLQGEAVLPLNTLDVVTGDNRLRHYRLPLTQPQKLRKHIAKLRQVRDDVENHGSREQGTLPAIHPLHVLKTRTGFDKDADEFYRWRKKLLLAKDSEYQPTK